jgi:hypothetical protein
MRFINDLADAYPWATPAPIGYVEPGWVAIVTDLLIGIDRAITTHPGATLDILDLRELHGALHVTWVLDGGSDHTGASVAGVVAAAQFRSKQICHRCGNDHASHRPTRAERQTAASHASHSEWRRCDEALASLVAVVDGSRRVLGPEAIRALGAPPLGAAQTRRDPTSDKR